MPQRRKQALHSQYRRRETYENERAINHYSHYSRYYPPQEPRQSSCCMAFFSSEKTSHYIQVSTIIKLFAYPKISSAFQSPTTPFPTTTNLVPHPFPSLIKILEASSVSLLSQKQPSSVAPMWLWTQTNTSSREPKKTNKGSNATTKQHPTGT